MDTLKGFFSFLVNFAGLLGSILGIWSMIRSPEEVKETLRSWGNYFQALMTTKQPKQPGKSQPVESLSGEDPSAIFDSAFDSAFDSSRGAVLKSDVKQQPKKQYMDYIYFVAILIIILIILNFVATRLASIPEPEVFPLPVNWTSSGGMNVASLFWTFVCLFGIIGAMRGWAKEILVIFTGVIALAVNLLLSKYLPFVKDLSDNSISLFWIRSIVLFVLVYFGYQTVVSISRLGSRAARERLQDSLLGAMLGGINGYLIAGSILSYFHKAEYPYENIIAPATDLNFLETINKLMAFLPPNLLGEPGIYFVVLILLAIVFIVYV